MGLFLIDFIFRVVLGSQRHRVQSAEMTPSPTTPSLPSIIVPTRWYTYLGGWASTDVSPPGVRSLQSRDSGCSASTAVLDKVIMPCTGSYRGFSLPPPAPPTLYSSSSPSLPQPWKHWLCYCLHTSVEHFSKASTVIKFIRKKPLFQSPQPQSHSPAATCYKTYLHSSGLYFDISYSLLIWGITYLDLTHQTL